MVELELEKRKLGSKVDLLALIAYRLAADRMVGDFQSERLAVGAGERMGRELADSSSARSIVNDVANLIQKANLGSVKVEKPEAKKGGPYEYLALYKVTESGVAYGVPAGEKPVCHLLRGLIRGAMAQVYHQENIAVRETQCIGIGAPECVFEAYWVPM